MNTFPKLTATEELTLQQNGKLYIASVLYNLTSTEAESVLDFHRDNYLDSFYYYLNTLRGYNDTGDAFYYDTDSCKFVLAKDTDYDNLAINASLTTYQTTSSTTSVNVTFDEEEATLFVEQEYYSSPTDDCYLKIYNTEFVAKVRVVDNYLMLNIATDTESYARKIPLTTKTYTIAADTYTYFVYAVSYSSSKFCIAHNGIAYEIELNTSISDMTGITIVNGDTTYKNIDNLIVSESYSDDDFLEGFTNRIDDTITITLGSDSAALSESKQAYLYAKERLTAKFRQRDITADTSTSGYNIRLKLKEV